MASEIPWERPSERVADLLRAAVERLLADRETLFAEVDSAVLAAADDALVADPVLAAAVRKANRANLVHWAMSNLRDPGAPVAPNVGPDTVELARDLVRRGFDTSSLNGYRTGQNRAVSRFMDTAFTLTDDLDELRELLELGTHSIFTFVDRTL